MISMDNKRATTRYKRYNKGYEQNKHQLPSPHVDMLVDVVDQCVCNANCIANASRQPKRFRNHRKQTEHAKRSTKAMCECRHVPLSKNNRSQSRRRKMSGRGHLTQNRQAPHTKADTWMGSTQQKSARKKQPKVYVIPKVDVETP